MARAGIAMLGGMLCLLLLPALPPVWIVLFAAAPLTVFFSWQRRIRFLLFAAFGFVWAWCCAQHLLANRLQSVWEGRTLTLRGWVASIPQQETDYVRFRFEVESLNGRVPGDGIPRELRLTWSGTWHKLSPGQHWAFRVRLKRPHGYMNPGGFDYEGWLFRQGIGATGYVWRDRAQLLHDPPRFPLLRLRAGISRAIAAALPHNRFAGIAAALVVGDTSGISPAQWQVFRNTGTAHLMAISGLHIGLLAGMIFLLTRLLWKRSAWLCERIPLPVAAAVAAMLAACVYAALAGFSIPTQRALIMLAAVTAATVLRQRVRWQDLLGMAVIGVMMLDPLSVCSIGFWLSFGAVTAIFYAMSGRSGERSNRPVKLLRTQWAVGIGLLPLLVLFFRQTALLSPLANLIAVPLYSLLVVPLVLFGTVLLSCWHWGGVLLLKWATGIMKLSWLLLAWLAALPDAQLLAPAPDWLTILVAILGAGWLLAPRGIPARWLGAVLLLPLFVGGRAAIPAGNFDLTLLDVGQGLSAVVRTAHHTLLYDTGPAFSASSDTVKLVVLPWLQARGITRPDLVVVSHADNDHAGGLPRLRRRFPALPVLSGAVGHFRGVWLCIAGQHWRWDGVRFDVLYPDKGAPDHGNNASCVLKISGAGGQALLVGDLMRAGERRLLNKKRADLAAQALVAPHHGSNSSSTPAFVGAVGPKLVLFPVGYRNRWHFPKPRVVARYLAAGAALADTVHDGAINVSFRSGRPPGITSRWRKDAARLWTAR